MSPFKTSRIDTIQTPLIGQNLKIDILRDDLIHPIASGNKWRKLKYIVDYALKNKIDTMVSFGGAYSNHLVALAYAGNHFNIPTFGFVRGDEKRELNHYEKICIENKMQLMHVSRNSYKNKIELYKQHFKNNSNSLYIDEGGNHPLSEKGIAEILEDLNSEYDYIVLSLGTGTTFYGLVKAAINLKLKTKFIGISSLKNNFELDSRMKEFDPKHYTIYHQFHRGKYAKSDNELMQFIKDFYDETGIKTEMVYTAKMLMALNELITDNSIDKSKKILCLHTGGLLAFPF